jgi:serum/glucocorticoid-regulated kinase 2
MPTQIAHQPSFRSGTLTIRIFSGNYSKHILPSYPSLCASKPSICLRRQLTYRPLSSGRGLVLSPGVRIPDVIQKALDAGPPPRTSSSNRESMQRRRYWWLPYIVLEFDKNEILIDSLAGDLANPVWNYRADL